MGNLVLKPVLDLTEAGPLATALLAARGEPICIDASAAEKIGAQCVQVLLSAHATWANDGHTLTIANPSDAFSEALKTLGISVNAISE